MIDHIQNSLVNENGRLTEERDKALKSAGRWRTSAFTLWCTTCLLVLACFIIGLGQGLRWRARAA